MKLLFQNEIFGTAQSLSLDENSLYHGAKSELLKRFDKVNQPHINPFSAIVIEFSAIIRFHCNIKVNTFNDFAKSIYAYVMELSANFHRIDVICDQYFEKSLKNQTRSERGLGSNVNFDDLTSFPNDFGDNFLKNSDNKEKLNHFLAEKMITLHANSDKCLVITKGNSIITNTQDMLNDELLKFCPSEEADPRLLRHMIQCVQSGMSTVVVRTVDSDVLVLLLAYRQFAKKLGC